MSHDLPPAETTYIAQMTKENECFKIFTLSKKVLQKRLCDAQMYGHNQ